MVDVLNAGVQHGDSRLSPDLIRKVVVARNMGAGGFCTSTRCARSPVDGHDLVVHIDEEVAPVGYHGGLRLVQTERTIEPPIDCVTSAGRRQPYP